MKFLLLVNLVMVALMTSLILLNDCGRVNNEDNLTARLEQCMDDFNSIVEICIDRERNHGDRVQGQ